MKIDGDFGADDLQNETRYGPNINMIWKTLRYFYRVDAKLTFLTKKVIFTLKPARGAQADNCGLGGNIRTGVNKKTFSVLEEVLYICPSSDKAHPLVIIFIDSKAEH
jgi:hypothetical protein